MVYILFSSYFINIYLNIHNVNNLYIVHLAKIFIAISAILQLIDTVRNILIGILRGFHDERVTMSVSIVSCWIIGIPVSVAILYWVHDPIWLRLGLPIGIVCGTIYLFKRFISIHKSSANM